MTTALHLTLLACSKKKTPHAAPAAQLYSASPLFRASLDYALSRSPGVTFVLSAKHGLVDLDETIEPYDMTIRDIGGRAARRAWGEHVVHELARRIDVVPGSIEVLAGLAYEQHVHAPLVRLAKRDRDPWPRPTYPLAGLTIGPRIAALRAALRDGGGLPC